MTGECRQFGSPPAGHETPTGAAAYALVVDGDRVLVIDDGTAFALPGGPVEIGTDPADTLRDELRRGTGHDLGEAVPFHRARQWTEVDGVAMNVECWFFVVELGPRDHEPLPDDTVARWAPQEAALDLLGHEASRWALSVVLAAKAITGALTASPPRS